MSRLVRLIKAIGLGAVAALFTTGCGRVATCYVQVPLHEPTSPPAGVREDLREGAKEKGTISPEAADKLDRADEENPDR